MGHSLQHRQIPGSLVEGKRRQDGSSTVDSLVREFDRLPYDRNISRDRKLLRKFMDQNPSLAKHLSEGNRKLRARSMSDGKEDSSRYLQRVPSGRSGVHSYNQEHVAHIAPGQSRRSSSTARQPGVSVYSKKLSTSPLRKSVQQEDYDLKLSWMSLRNAEHDDARRSQDVVADAKMRMYLVPHKLDHRTGLQAKLIEASMASAKAVPAVAESS